MDKLVKGEKIVKNLILIKINCDLTRKIVLKLNVCAQIRKFAVKSLSIYARFFLSRQIIRGNFVKEEQEN